MTELSAGQWQSLMSAGHDAYNAGRIAQAEEHFKAALIEAEQFGGMDDRLARTLINLAAIYQVQGKYGMAERLYRRALGIRESLFGRKRAEVAVVLYNLAVLNSARRRYDEAEPLYRECLEIRETAPGVEHADLDATLTSYARLLRLLGRVAEAEALEERARKHAGKSGADAG